MVDVGKTIEAKSNQLNADDLLAGPRTITITAVKGHTSEQPIAINYDGDNGKPFLPCKTVRRIMVALWGDEGSLYVGRQMTIYRDPDVPWGGIKVGGTRVSHMSDIDKIETVMLYKSRGNKVAYIIKPLEKQHQQTQSEPTPIDLYGKELKNALSGSVEDFEIWWVETAKRREELNIPEERLANMNSAANAKLSEGSDQSE